MWLRKNAMILRIGVGPGLAQRKIVRPLLLLTLPWLVGCFYLAVINVAPVAKISRVDAGPVYLNSAPLRFSAKDSVDEDGDELRFAWGAQACAGCSELQGEAMEF